VPLRVAPQTLQPVERAAVAAEDVDDEVEVVEQDPFRPIDSLPSVSAAHQIAFSVSRHAVGDGRDLTRVAAGADHEEVR
jgi:hypothetical protein